MNRIRIVVLLCLALLGFVLTATGCIPGAPLLSPAELLPTATASMASPITSAVAPQPGALPAAPPALPFADNWDDRLVYRSGLIQAEQDALNGLPGASIYHLAVRISDDLLSLQGRQRVRYTNQETVNLDAVYFQLFPNMEGGRSTVSAVTVDGRVTSATYEFGDTTLRVPLGAPLRPGERVVIEMDFQVRVPTALGGGYGLFGYLSDVLALDGFYPAIPVYDAKGWHAGPVPPNADTTFQDASFYLVRVSAPATVTLVASGVAIESIRQEGGQAVTFVAGPARDFYIAGSLRFSVVNEKVGETRVNSYAFKESEAGSRLALATAVGAIKSYSARFGPYPYTELDVVSTPMQGATGIEYPGLTGINYSVYDLSGQVSGVAAPVMMEGTVAHEVGHQWFYNVVGNDQANEPWLDEAVTQYVTGLYYLDTYGQQGMDGYRASWLSRWDRVDRQAIPIGLPAGSYQGREYVAIVYGRGPLFLEALALKMGDATLARFLRDYYQANKWGIATTASFKQVAEQDCGCDLTAMFGEWVYKK
jgi:hypothetical protein